MYYNARYYDPALGTFISPDTMVPGAGQVINYNRFLYARGNPLKYTDPTGNDPLGPEWVEAFKAAHGGREPTDSDRFDRLISLTSPGPVSGSLSWMDEDWRKYSEAKAAIRQSIEDRTESEQQIWLDQLKQKAANVINWLIPPGAAGAGVTASTGALVDLTGEMGVYFDKSGDFNVGLTLGLGGTTGANLDLGLFAQYFPWASGAGVMEDWTVNVGVSGILGPPVILPIVFAGVGGALEINVATDPETEDPTVGFTVVAAEGVKSNFPFPPVELYGNATHTWFVYRLNIYDVLGLPRPEQ